MAPLFQLAVELVQQDIGQQRGQRPALWRTDLAGLDVLTDQALQAAFGQQLELTLTDRPVTGPTLWEQLDPAVRGAVIDRLAQAIAAAAANLPDDAQLAAGPWAG